MFESERRDLAWVPRWGIVRVNRRQSVAEHSFFVASYGAELAKRLNWGNEKERYDLIVYLLRHDESECLEGDIPGPVKRLCGFDGSKLKPLLEARFGPAPQYTPEMRAIKKAADLIDECFYLAGELNSGNQAVKSSLKNAQDRLWRALSELPGDREALRRLKVELVGRIDAEITQSKNIGGYAEEKQDWPTQEPGRPVECPDAELGRRFLEA